MELHDLKMRVRRVHQSADGAWLRIFVAAGMAPKHFEKQNRPCPLCGGTDRFSYFAKESQGRWYCRCCGSGDGISLVQKFRHTGFVETIVWLEHELALPPFPHDFSAVAEYRLKVALEHERKARRRAELEALWASAKPLGQEDSPVKRYLASRGLGSIDPTPELRWTEALPYRDQLGKDGTESVWPAMLSRVSDAEGKIVSIHRTYLTKEGAKAPVAVVKKLTAGPLEDGFIRLYPPSNILCLAEGIETALSVHELTGLPVWSVISLSGFQRFDAPPEGVRVIRIYGDNDASFTGAAGAYALAARLRQRHPDLAVEVLIPPEVGVDWNDVLNASRVGA